MGSIRKNTLLIGAGGTGGHIHPALAIADAFHSVSPSTRIVFCGEKGSFEESVTRKEGYPFYSVAASALPARRSFQHFSWFARNARGIAESLSILRIERPALVFGTGGYVTAPLITASKICRVPYFLHEQNSIPGRANRLFAKGAKCVFIAYEESRPHFKETATLRCVGNPVRSVFHTLRRDASREILGLSNDVFLVLVVGGSLGAVTINRAVEGLGGETSRDWTELLKRHPEISVCVSTGQKGDQALADKLSSIPHVTAEMYLDDMPLWLSACDLYIGRAGAMSCAEITALSKPSMLVPYPFAADDHQRANARIMESKGASRVCLDQYFNSSYLLGTIERMIVASDELSEMGRRAGELAAPEAAHEIAAQTLALMGGRL